MRRKMKQLMGILLTLALILGLMPGVSLTALAYDGNPYASLVGTTTSVTFNGKPWYIIADNSMAVDDGTVTLLAADTSFGLSAFDSNGTSKAYSSSTVKSVLDALTAEGGAFASVKGAIVNTDLTDVGVTGAELYLLSTSEAQALSSDVLKMGFSSTMSGWWLRSAGIRGEDAAFVTGEDGSVYGNGLDVFEPFGVRPALKLNLSSVIFSSVNLSGGANTEISGGTATQNYFDMGNTRGAMTTVTYTANANYKFPETSELYKETNGITVAVSQDQKTVTVSGTPTANATIMVPDAVAIPTYTVTYKVVNGTWSDDSTTDKTETVQSGSSPASVPTGMKAASGCTGGAWDTNPADATITGAKTFTYTFTAKQASTVTKAPTAKNLTYNGQAQALVTAGTAEGGEMQYALGTKDAATEPYTTSIPTKTDAGTYYVWYKAKGNDTHSD